jgi:proteasome alpha subunit
MSQAYTQHAGVRPFGVTMILAGVDATGPRVLTTDPSGAYRGFKAVAVGRKNDEANKLLEEKYSMDISLEDAIKLAIEAVKIASDSEINEETAKVAIVPAETKVFKRLESEEIKSYLD